MEKKVTLEIAFILFAALAKTATWWYFREESTPGTIITDVQEGIPFSTNQVANGCLDEGKAIVALLSAIDAQNVEQCPDEPILNAQCKAALGIDTCAELTFWGDHDICQAIVQKIPANCGTDGFCRALAGDTQCFDEESKEECVATSTRDTSYFIDENECMRLAQLATQ